MKKMSKVQTEKTLERKLVNVYIVQCASCANNLAKTKTKS